ncbi:MAG: nicotinate-nucleotide--dimethylbenzimidazole phosphoribosyltransferase, partial [Pseudomonadota bacterium]
MQMDAALREALQHKIDTKTKPLGALGRIEDLAAQIGMLQGRLDPVAERCGLTIFAGDHGLADAGVSAFPKAVTHEMVKTFMAGGAAANAFADALGVFVRVVDAGIETPVEHPNLLSRRIGPGTANSAEGPAMMRYEAEEAMATGRALGAEWDFPVVAYGDMGIGNTATSALLIH